MAYTVHQFAEPQDDGTWIFRAVGEDGDVLLEMKGLPSLEACEKIATNLNAEVEATVPNAKTWGPKDLPSKH